MHWEIPAIDKYKFCAAEKPSLLAVRRAKFWEQASPARRVKEFLAPKGLIATLGWEDLERMGIGLAWDPTNPD